MDKPLCAGEPCAEWFCTDMVRNLLLEDATVILLRKAILTQVNIPAIPLPNELEVSVIRRRLSNRAKLIYRKVRNRNSDPIQSAL
jgi:hypothetical protein